MIHTELTVKGMRARGHGCAAVSTTGRTIESDPCFIFPKLYQVTLNAASSFTSMRSPQKKFELLLQHNATSSAFANQMHASTPKIYLKSHQTQCVKTIVKKNTPNFTFYVFIIYIIVHVNCVTLHYVLKLFWDFSELPGIMIMII